MDRRDCMTREEFIQNDLAIKVAELTLQNAQLKADINVLQEQLKEQEGK